MLEGKIVAPFWHPRAGIRTRGVRRRGALTEISLAQPYNFADAKLGVLLREESERRCALLSEITPSLAPATGIEPITTP